MSKCKYCGNGGWFTSVDGNGLCGTCAPIYVPIIANHARIVVESGKIVDRSKRAETIISRCDVAKASLLEMKPYEEAGIPVLTYPVEEAFEEFDRIGRDTLEREIFKLVSTAREKAKDGTTQASKLSGFNSSISKLSKLMDEITDCSEVELAIERLRFERDAMKAQLLCEKAEVYLAKGKKPKALETYVEAYMALKQDGTDDAEQVSLFEFVGRKITELGGDVPD